jgi:hypothetical protein
VLRDVRAKRAAGAIPSAEELLRTIGAYIPTEVTTAYVAVAGGMATLKDLPSRTRLLVAVGVAILSVFVTWTLGHRAAGNKAVAEGKARRTALHTFREGWYEILAAGVAFFTWATAMPSSWVEWGANMVWAPALLVFAASVVIGGLGVLFNRTA